MKICLIASSGGHLTQILQLKPFFKEYAHFLVTSYSKHLEEFAQNEDITFIEDPRRQVLPFIKNIIQSLIVLVKRKPDIIITTGAGLTIPLCYWGKLFSKRIIYIESFSRVGKPSLTGRLVYPISDLFIIQWKELRQYYPQSLYGGMIF